jgi:hypothetical protein
MTHQGPNECSNRALKCYFTPKGTFRHCQRPTVARNAVPVPPFPAPRSSWLAPLTASSLSMRPHPRTRADGDPSASAAGPVARRTPAVGTTRSGHARRGDCSLGPCPRDLPGGEASLVAARTASCLGTLRTLPSALSNQPRGDRRAVAATQSLRAPTLCASNIPASNACDQNSG